MATGVLLVTRIDQFESVFRAAAKPRYVPRSIEVGRVMVVTDLDREAGSAYTARIMKFLSALVSVAGVEWVELHGEADSVGALLAAVQDHDPDLVCTYRNLHSGAFRWPYTLGDHAELLTQVAEMPVLLLPRPDDEGFEGLMGGTGEVMAITDHLAGDGRLVDWAAAFTAPGGTLFLAHVEDDRVFERYLEVISKIPEIDTDVAREKIAARLLKEPADYVEGIRAAIDGLTVESEVMMGHHLGVYRRLVEAHGVDLLVFNTKDDDQLAMHGLAYALAVELRRVPMLLL